MIKITIYILLLFTMLDATVPSSDEQNSIYMEGIFFLLVFGVMGIISYIYSTKHAKEYKSTEIKVEEKSPFADRIAELSEMHKNDLLTKDEFELLNSYYHG